MFFFIFLLIFIVLLLLIFGLVTVFERNFLGLSQLRFGPSKSLFLGFLQMFFDGLKLFFSEGCLILKSDEYYFFLASVMSFILMIFIYFFLSFFFIFCSWSWSFLFLFLQVAFMVFSLLLSSFFSKSKYSFLGSIRVSVGALSFDIVFILFCFYFLVLFGSYSFLSVFWFFFVIVFSFLLFMLVMVELNRAPFDFSEGESELVSGLNTEFSGVFFVFFFLSEYGMILFYILLMNSFFFNSSFFMGFLVFFCLIFIRSCFPRFRYDFLMYLCWLVLLPLETFFMFFYVFLF